MAKGYWVGRVTVHDDSRYPEYKAAGQLAYEKYGARFLVRGGQLDPVEGTSRPRNVIIEFKDYPTALACYNSPEYQRAKVIRNEISDSDLIVIEGVDD